MISNADFRQLIIFPFIAMALFGAHAGILYLMQLPWDVPGWSMPGLYGFFVVFGTLLLTAMLVMRKVNPDAVGYAFMIGTVLQMALVYFLVRPSLKDPMITHVGKVNIFAVFGIFLVTETVFGLRILNRIGK